MKATYVALLGTKVGAMTRMLTYFRVYMSYGWFQRQRYVQRSASYHGRDLHARKMNDIVATEWELMKRGLVVRKPWSWLTEHNIACSLLTCCSDAGEDPALSIWHRCSIGWVVFPQDLHAAAPRRGRHPIRVIPGPVPYQNSKVILSIDLEEVMQSIRLKFNIFQAKHDQGQWGHLGYIALILFPDSVQKSAEATI